MTSSTGSEQLWEKEAATAGKPLVRDMELILQYCYNVNSAGFYTVSSLTTGSGTPTRA